MPRRGMRALARLLRLSALGTLAVTLWLLASTPVARYYTANTATQLELSLDRALRRETDRAWLDGTLERALAQEPRDWVLIESALALAQDHGVQPSAEAAAAVLAARRQDKDPAGLAANCLACAMGDPLCRLDDGLACALGVELTPVGDARVLLAEGRAYAAGDEVDRVSVALAGMGLGATLAVVATGGAAMAVKGGVAVLRIARRAGRLSPALQSRLARIGGDLVDWQKLPARPAEMLDPAVYRAAVNGGALAAGTALVTQLDRLRRAVPAPHAVRLLGDIDSTADARRMADIAEVSGVRTVAVLHRLGKARAFRLTLRLSRTGRTLLALAAALGVQALGLLAARALGLTARAAARAAR